MNTIASDRLDGAALIAWRSYLQSHASILRVLDADLIAQHGLTSRDYEVLLYLAQAPDRKLPMSALAERTMLTRSGITRLVDGLVASGLIERVSCPNDARVSYAQLTDAGYEKLREAGCTHVASIHRLFLEHFSARGDRAARGAARPAAGRAARRRLHRRVAGRPAARRESARVSRRGSVPHWITPQYLTAQASCYDDCCRLNHLSERSTIVSHNHLARSRSRPAPTTSTRPTRTSASRSATWASPPCAARSATSQGTLDATGDAPVLEGTVEVASIDTGEENRDGHLTGARLLRRRPVPPDHLPLDRHGSRPATARSARAARSRSRASPSRSS